MTSLKERLAREMCEVEDWIDSTQQQFSSFLAGSGSSRRRSSFILSQACMDTVATILQQYHTRGFKKRRIQDGMEEAEAARPFEGMKFGTLREKHNIFMNFFLTLHTRQRVRREEEQRERDRVERERVESAEMAESVRREERARREAERLERERLEAERLEAERRHATWRGSRADEDTAEYKPRAEERDLRGLPLQLSGAGDAANPATEGRFIGSIYVHGEEEDKWSHKFLADRSSNWRVRL